MDSIELFDGEVFISRKVSSKIRVDPNLIVVLAIEKYHILIVNR
jgi:hypothetical protein